MKRTVVKPSPVLSRYTPLMIRTLDSSENLEGIAAPKSVLHSPIEYTPLFGRDQGNYSAITQASNTICLNFLYSSGISVVGRRQVNEDKHLVIEKGSNQIFAVFDGHGGSEAATFCFSNYYSTFLEQEIISSDAEDILKNTIESLDRQFCKMIKFSTVGTTACILFVRNNNVYYSNTGDSRLIVYFGGQVFETKDHSPKNERKRLTACGAKIINCFGIDRVDGNLSLSRSVGDEYMKRKGLISDPDIGLICTFQELDFAIVACDGLYGVLSTETVVNVIRSCLSGRPIAGAAQEKVLEAAVAYFVGDNTRGDAVLSKLSGQKLYKCRACCEIDNITSEPSKRLAEILCRIAYWKGSMDNITVVVVLNVRE